MKKLLQSRFVSNYGMIFVLMLLCAYFSVATIDQQDPVTVRAANKIVAFINGQPAAKNVLVVVPNGVEDLRFSNAIQQGIGQGHSSIVGAVAGNPAQTRAEFNRLGAAGTRVDFVVTQYAAAKWDILTTAGREELRQQYPSLGPMDVVKPASYSWPTFLTPQHLLTVANQTALTAIVAIGMTMVIITAGIDLSVGSLIALSGVVVATLVGRMAGEGDPAVLSLILCGLIAVAVCALLGAGSGLLATWFEVPAFIVTLGVMQIARGLAHKVAGGSKPVRVHSEMFHELSAGAEILGIPNPVIIMLLLYVAAHVLMSRTTLGRYLYAVGGNPEAARLSGVPVKTVVVFAYAVCGALAGLGGVLDASLFRTARASGALGYELQIIAAVVVGGTSLAGGQGKVLGTLIGALILGVISDGMRLTNVEYDTQLIVFGSVIVVAVLVDKLKSRDWRMLRG
ncbi:MAG: ABC transporter permease [Pirellulaceae bacterium]|jgi:ribose transport system permease protein|nr:ABC transporter permease [Pirellulaceae bacterium]MDP6553182.1 ABC transporter permease [Pirellulaceae bacterium]